MAQRLKDWACRCIQPAATDVPQPAANDFLKFCQRMKGKLVDMMKISRSSQEHLLNENQCRFLVERLSETLEGIRHSSHLDEKTSLVLQELRYVFVDAHRLIQSCFIKSTASDSERLRAAIEQGDMKNTFAKILYDVRWHTDVLQSILEDSGGPSTTFEAARCIGDLSGEDITALENAKEKDDKVLNERLRSLIQKLDRPPEKNLADQLLEHREVQAQSSGDLRHKVLFLSGEEMGKHLHGIKLGKGSYGEVRETDILGGRFAVKIVTAERNSSAGNGNSSAGNGNSSAGNEKVSMFKKEMLAMQGLGHHPNIVRLYCFSEIKDRGFLIMERMNDELGGILLQRETNKTEVSLVEKVVLMLEIAEGMRYIHSMRMAHRDLKPGNVLVNLEDSKNLSSRAYSVKIADFGLTKTKEASRTYKDQTTNVGTTRYMAPEMIDDERIKKKKEFNPMKADVYSFGIMCCQILTGQTPYGDLGLVLLKKEVKGNGDFRPDLQQVSGRLRLESLIQRCWDSKHRSRPDFKRICPELRYIKGLLLRGAFLMCCIFFNITHSHYNLVLQSLLAISVQS